MNSISDSPVLCACGCGQPAPISKSTDTSRGYVKGQPRRFIHNHHNNRNSVKTRFWTKVDRSASPDNCWPWLAYKGRDGYGRVSYEGSNPTASRVAYILTYGPVADNIEVCHTCDNPPCCNPAHLFLGSKADNMRDARLKGRMHPGEQHGMAKLSDDQVRAIREQYIPNVVGCKRLAKAFGVDPQTIARIVKRQAWTHIE